jgi:hypothetical protein
MFSHAGVCRKRRRVLRSATPGRRQCAGWLSMQRGTHRLLHLTPGSRISLCSVSGFVWRSARTNFQRNMEGLRSLERSTVDPRSRPASLFSMHPCRFMYALPWPGVHGRGHARRIVNGLREIRRSNRRIVPAQVHRSICRSGGSVTRESRIESYACQSSRKSEIASFFLGEDSVWVAEQCSHRCKNPEQRGAGTASRQTRARMGQANSDWLAR